MDSITVVVSRYNKNVDFVNKFPSDVKICVYDKENPKNPYNVPVNKGNEASAFLKYILDHYENLPEFTYCIHDEEYSWHHSGSIIEKFFEALHSNKLYYNVNHLILGSIIDNKECVEWFDQYIRPYFNINSDCDWTVGNRGCAQFLVHKSRILRLPKKFYEDIYVWLITTDLTSYFSSRYLEWTWHVFWDDKYELK